jgi:hypothetical protein
MISNSDKIILNRFNVIFVDETSMVVTFAVSAAVQVAASALAEVH